MEEALTIDECAATAHGLEGAVEVEDGLSGLTVVLAQLDGHDTLVGEALAEEVNSVAVRAGGLEAGVVVAEVCPDEEDIVIEEHVATLGVDGLGEGLDVCGVDEGEDRAGEGFGLPLAVGYEIGDEEGVVDGEGYVTGEDLVVVGEWGGAQRADTVAIEDVEDALHLVTHISFAGEDPSAYGFIALGIIGLLEGGDGAQTVGEPEDDSSEASRLVGDMGDDPFHRYLLDSRGGWASASPRCYKYNDSTLDSLAPKGDRIGGVRRGYSARLFSWHSWGRWSEVVEREVKSNSHSQADHYSSDCK